MSKEELIKKLHSEQGFKNLCNKLCQYNDLANDLYQEFMLVVCETPEEVLKEKLDKGLINFFCVRVIINLNLLKGRKYLYGGSNTLNNLTSFCENVDSFGYVEDLGNVQTPKTLTYDPEGTEILQTARQLLLSDMANGDKGTKRDALRLYETCYLHKNLYQYSLVSDITRQGLMKSIKKATDKLKKRL